VLIAPSTTPPNDSHTVLGFLTQELSSIDGGFSDVGFVEMPTRGSTDYWLDSFNFNLNAGIADGIYIDEAYVGYDESSALIGGSGYTDASVGINRVGFNTLGVRTYLERLRQLFLDHNRRPVVWLDASNGSVTPHMWAFADFVSDGEGIDFSSGSPDFIDRYNTTKGNDWLLGVSRAVKYGWIPVFLDEISGHLSKDRKYGAYYRSMIAMLELADISPIGTYNGPWINYMRPRLTFGIAAPDVTFHGYWDQIEIQSDNADVKASYYRRTTTALAIISNLGEAPYTGNITIDASALGLSNLAARDGETDKIIDVTNNTIRVSIPRHDYLMIQLRTVPRENSGREREEHTKAHNRH
jgi:hypothetical protein